MKAGMKTSMLWAGALALIAVTQASEARGQQTEAARVAPPAVGTMAPDFELPGATRYGLLANPVKLSDFRGQTVVLAYFYRARSSG